MRKCLHCGIEMKSNLRVKVNGGGYGIVVSVNETLTATNIGDLRAAICPNCGHVETYIEDISKLRELPEEK